MCVQVAARKVLPYLADQLNPNKFHTQRREKREERREKREERREKREEERREKRKGKKRIERE